MARKPRIEFSGAFYHVIVRDNRLAAIFHADADYLAYLDRLERYRLCDGRPSSPARSLDDQSAGRHLHRTPDARTEAQVRQALAARTS